MIGVNIISGIFVVCIVFVIAFRALSRSGMAVTDNMVFNTLLKNTSQNQGFSITKKETAAVFAIAFLFRVLVFIISIFAIFIMLDEPFSFEKLLDIYMQWDANNYFRIATGGYSYYVENGNFTTLAFFPLYPWLVRIFNVLFNNLTLSGLFVSALAYSGACAYLYNLVSFDYNKQTAIRAIVFISVFPHSLFFGTMMSESVFLFTVCATLYYIRRHAWEKAGIFGALSAMSRLSGIILAIPAAIEWFEHYRIIKLMRTKSYKKVWRLFYKKGLWIFLMAAGTLTYLVCNYYTTGEWFKFLEYQKNIWNNTTVYWGECLSVILGQIHQNKSFSLFALWIPELIAIIFTAVVLVYGLRKTRSMYTAFLTVYLIINMSMSWPLSIGRYMSCAVTSFIILSDFAERHRWAENLITVVFAIAFGVFFTAYFASRQIM